MQTTQLKVSGMMCEACVGHVTNALQGVEGVREVKVELSSGQATVQHENADVNALQDAVREEGYEVQAA